MTLDEIADAIEAEWYSAPRLHDWRSPQRCDDEAERTVSGEEE